MKSAIITTDDGNTLTFGNLAQQNCLYTDNILLYEDLVAGDKDACKSICFTGSQDARAPQLEFCLTKEQFDVPPEMKNEKVGHKQRWISQEYVLHEKTHYILRTPSPICEPISSKSYLLMMFCL